MSKCLCGHDAMSHLGGKHGKRGKCVMDRRVAPEQQGVRYRDADAVSAEDFKKIFGNLSSSAKARCIKRGYALIPCGCPYYHEVEIGQVAVIKPVEQRQEPSRPTPPGKKIILP